MAQKILMVRIFITEEIVPAGIEILKEKGYEVDCKSSIFLGKNCSFRNEGRS